MRRLTPKEAAEAYVAADQTLAEIGQAAYGSPVDLNEELTGSQNPDEAYFAAIPAFVNSAFCTWRLRRSLSAHPDAIPPDMRHEGFTVHQVAYRMLGFEVECEGNIDREWRRLGAE